jgi:hypothetical protein
MTAHHEPSPLSLSKAHNIEKLVYLLTPKDVRGLPADKKVRFTKEGELIDLLQIDG